MSLLILNLPPSSRWTSGLRRTSKSKISKMRGFTLIELMVTIGIFVFMTAIILARYNTFGSGTILTNMAYDIALTIRQAQTYGISVKSAGGDFKTAYGVHFSKNDDKKFTLFADYDDDRLYGSSEEIASYNLKSGAKIFSICTAPNANECINDNTNDLDITFIRPDPKATICKNSNNCNNNNNLKYAKITISSADGSSTRKIIVTEMGQIYVEIN